jgi:hypothetical protein
MRNHFPEFCGEVANISNDLSHHVVEYIPGKRWFDLCVPDGPGVYRPVALDTSKACFVPASRWSSPHQPIRQSKQLRSWPASQSCRQGIVWVGRPPVKSRIPAAVHASAAARRRRRCRGGCTQRKAARELNANDATVTKIVPNGAIRPHASRRYRARHPARPRSAP